MFDRVREKELTWIYAGVDFSDDNIEVDILGVEAGGQVDQPGLDLLLVYCLLGAISLEDILLLRRDSRIMVGNRILLVRDKCTQLHYLLNLYLNLKLRSFLIVIFFAV